jgi:hypothetical protein
MPVVPDPDAAAVYKAFREAGRPAYETLTAPEARARNLAGLPPAYVLTAGANLKLLQQANVAVGEIGAWLKQLG